jgi:LmbE family N-acetylglucosaminyl deacetylase
MATLVCFHAHPDDEAIATGGLMAASAAAGHRVVLVVATRGEEGEPVAGVLAPGEALGDRRTRETRASAALLGAERVEFLGYRDSGMMGEPTNADPACFWRAPVAEAAARLAAVLREVGAGLLTTYDAGGTYGHPDHIQVHRVGARAAQLAGVPVFEATVNREVMARLKADIDASRGDAGPNANFAVDAFGLPPEAITHRIDVRAHLERKRAAMTCHASQIAADDWLLTMPEHRFEALFGAEWFVRSGHTRTAGEPFASELLARREGRMTMPAGTCS